MSVVLSVATWIENTPFSTAIRESIWIYPIVQSAHVLGLAVFLGLTVLMDGRLVGIVLAGTPVSEVMGRLLPWIRWGFALMAVTGLVLTITTPLRFYDSPFYRAKLLLLASAGINIWIFHARLYPAVADWGQARIPPLPARLAGGISLALWTAVVVAGRLIAYNWFQ